jgi:Glycosyl hydrolase family 79, N-terminal domain
MDTRLPDASHRLRRVAGCVLLLSSTIAANEAARSSEQSIHPATMPRIAEVDARFQSYNVEMVEVTGGKFWRPYASRESAAPPGQDLYADRPPTDLANARLRMLASALSPAYVRVSGTWANSAYFADYDSPLSEPPAGFASVLSRTRWHAVIDFARAVDAEIVTSFAVSSGTRTQAGIWSTDQARRLLAYTRSLHANIAAAEFMNEPNLAAQNGAPAGYDAKAYGRDFKIFRAFIRQTSPKTLVVGPSSTGETPSGSDSRMRTSDLLAASGRGLDVFSFHHYATLSQRCGGRDKPEDILSDEWLSRTDRALAFYSALRDRFEPGTPLWLTETADAACGGNPWDATFADTFRYLDQLGRLARVRVQVVMHNTLAASDYGLLDEKTFDPRPDYWAALLWHRLMGRIVLDPKLPAQPDLHVYAHCHPKNPGGVSILVINLSRDASHAFRLPIASERTTLHAPRLESKTVELNGKALALDDDDALPDMAGTSTSAGVVTFAPTTITFLAMPKAANRACR